MATTTTAAIPLVDVLIIGGGPAGLSAATGLARQLQTAIVFSSGKYRNAAAAHMHNVAGWDHRPPAEFRAKARADLLARYETIQFRDVEVATIVENGGRFEAVDVEGNRYAGKKVVLGTGVRDVLPDIPGAAELWGRGIFHCLFCHGFEERGSASAGLLAVGASAVPMMAAAMSRMAGRLAASVNVYTHGDAALGRELRAALKSQRKYRIVDGRIARFAKDPDVRGDGGVLVHLEDGTVLREGFVAHGPEGVQASDLPRQLGVEFAEQGQIKVSAPFQSTSVPGVFAAGDCATLFRSVVMAMEMGGFGAAGICHTLQAEEDVPDE